MLLRGVSSLPVWIQTVGETGKNLFIGLITVVLAVMNLWLMEGVE